MVRGIERGAVFEDDKDRDNLQQRLKGIPGLGEPFKPQILVALTLSSECFLSLMS
jgi:hypothetical protein